MAVIPSQEGIKEVIKCSIDSRLRGNDRGGTNLNIIIFKVIVIYTFDGNWVSSLLLKNLTGFIVHRRGCFFITQKLLY